MEMSHTIRTGSASVPACALPRALLHRQARGCHRLRCGGRAAGYCCCRPAWRGPAATGAWPCPQLLLSFAPACKSGSPRLDHVRLCQCMYWCFGYTCLHLRVFQVPSSGQKPALTAAVRGTPTQCACASTLIRSATRARSHGLGRATPGPFLPVAQADLAPTMQDPDICLR